MPFLQLVIGPAGSGKSTYCRIMQEHYENVGRCCKVINLDPAADEFFYDCALDIRNMIELKDVMEETDYGPNGGLVFAMEYIIENITWLEERMNEFGEDDLIMVDCPGQIELVTHIPMMRQLVDALHSIDCVICGVYCLDISFTLDTPKFISGLLNTLCAMIQLELPHVNILTKCDLLNEKEMETLDKMLASSPEELIEECKSYMHPRFKKLNIALCSLLEEYSLVSLLPLNPNDDDSITNVAYVVSTTIHHDEDRDTKAKYDMEQK